MASLKDIAKDTGFAVSVISRALNPKPDKNARVSPETRRIILAAAQRLGFRPNRAAEFLKRGGSPAIGVFLPAFANRLIADLVIGLSEAAEPLGFPLNLYFGLTAESYELFLQNAAAAAHSGIITYPFDLKLLNEKVVADKLERYRAEKGSVLVLNASATTPTEIPSLNLDNQVGGRLAAERLLARGCREFLTYPRFQGRTEGFIEAVEEKGGRAAVFDSPGLQRRLDGLAKARTTGSGPIGLFATTDEHALKAYRIAKDCGLKVGADLLVIGYDDLSLTPLVDPPLTTIQQPFRELGARAVAKLVNMIYGKAERSEKIPPRLVVRESA